MAKGAAHGAESVDELQHTLGRVVDTFTGVGVLQLNDTPASLASGIDCMHFEPAVTDEPRHYLLSHFLSLLINFL
jgi:hypothetical protein